MNSEPDPMLHGHGSEWLHSHPGGNVPHQHRKERGTGMTVLVVVLIVLAVLLVLHEAVLASRNNPPESCQLLGGHWNIFTGWHCG